MLTDTTPAPIGADALPRYAAWRHLCATGTWPNGAPEWAKNADGWTNDATVLHAVIDELVAALASAAQPARVGTIGHVGDGPTTLTAAVAPLLADAAAPKAAAAPAAVAGPHVTDAMALAFHNALSDGAIGSDEVEEIKTGLRAALAGEPAPAAAPKAAPAQVPTPDVQAKIDSNTWDNLADVLPVLKAASRGEWGWPANSRCKYIELRIDMRDGGCLIRDREGVRISPAQLAYQSHPGGMPWSATEAAVLRPTPAAQGDALAELMAAASELVETIELMDEDALLALDDDPHPPSSLAAGAERLRVALAARAAKEGGA